MVDFEAAIEVLLDFTNFYNIDLKYSGYYQVRAQLRSSKKTPYRTEISIQRSAAHHLFPASVVNGRAVGTTFEIVYQVEDISLDDSILFRTFVPINSSNIPKVVNLDVLLELWFIEKDELLQKNLDDVYSTFKCISKRCLTLNLPIFRGLYYRRPILFDYFHLSGLILTVYSSLIGLNILPPHEKINNQPQISPDENLFRNIRSGDQRLKHAYLCHRNLCWLLLTAYEALELKFTQFIQYLPKQCQIRIQSVDCAKKFEILQQNLQRITDENEISRSILNTNKLLSSELSLLWRQFLDLFKRQPAINKFLASEHHNARVKRFGESFLCCESTTQHLLSSISGDRLRTQEKLVDILRKSQYFLNLPLLAVSCDILDGSPELTPIIFEEKYHPAPSPRSNFSHYLTTNSQFSFHSTPDFLSSLTVEDTDKKNGHSIKTTVDGKRSLTESFPSRQRNNSEKIDKKSLRLNFRRVFTPNFDVKKKTKRKKSVTSIKKSARSRSSSYFERETIDRSLALKLSIRSQSAEYICGNSAKSIELSNSSHEKTGLDFIDRSSEPSSPYDSLVDQDIIKASDSLSPLRRNSPSPTPARLTSGVDEELLQFLAYKEAFKQKLKNILPDGYVCSDCSAFPSKWPYFDDISIMSNEKRALTDINSFFRSNTHKVDFHLIVCVHGLEGTWADLKMVRSYLELALHAENNAKISFLMSRRNQITTFDDFQTMSKNLVDEILLYLSQCNPQPSKISFIGHSLGNIIIRAALCDPRLEPLLERLNTFLSLNGPHCGILYNSSVVNMGIKLIQRWKKSTSLQQLGLKDHVDLRECYLYKLSLKPCLQYFKNILLVGSFEDYYVPIHSALIEFSRASSRDQSILGIVYSEMVQNLLRPLSLLGCSTVVRYSVHHSSQASSAASQWIGKAAHVAVLDSDLFIEKLFTVSALKYFM